MKQIRVLCFGDSNTWGYRASDGERFPRESRWTGILKKNLGDHFEIIEEGLNGRTTAFTYRERVGKNGLEYLRPCLDSHYPLDIVVICLGSNDCKREFAKTPEEITDGMEKCLRAIRGEGLEDPSPNVKIILMAPARIDEHHIGDYEEMRGAEKKTEAFPKLYGALAKKYQAHFVSLFDVVQPSPVDGCHFEADEHVKVAGILEKAIREALSQS